MKKNLNLRIMKKKLMLYMYGVEKCVIKENRENQNVDKKIEELINLEECKVNNCEKDEIGKKLKDE